IYRRNRSPAAAAGLMVNRPPPEGSQALTALKMPPAESHITTEAQEVVIRIMTKSVIPLDNFDFSGLQTGQPVGYQQSHGAMDIYAQHVHTPRDQTQAFYSPDARGHWRGHDMSHLQRDHQNVATGDILGGAPGMYRRGGGGRDMSSMQAAPYRRGQQAPLSSFDAHGRNIYTGQSAYPPSPAHSGGSISPVMKSDSPGSMPIPLTSGESSERYQPIADWLRENANIPHNKPLDLYSLPDPPPGARPNVTYKILASLAIYGSPSGRLSLQEIYTAIEDRFPYYRNLPEEMGRDGKSGGKKWQRSVRHNLSLESIFMNDPRSITEPGKGGYWYISNLKGYGQKRERKRKGKSSSASSTSSRESYRIKEEDDDGLFFDDDYDEDDLSAEERGGSSHGRRPSSRHGHASSSQPSMARGPAAFPTFGQTSLGPQPPRTRPQAPRTNSVPEMHNYADSNARPYPTRPSTVPMYSTEPFDPSAAVVSEHQYPHGTAESGYTYEMGLDEGSRRSQREDKGKRRAPF
ncbi:hypothetical protein H0H92_013361, partial [Tricholoma furcatifolium]